MVHFLLVIKNLEEKTSYETMKVGVDDVGWTTFEQASIRQCIFGKKNNIKMCKSTIFSCILLETSSKNP